MNKKQLINIVDQKHFKPLNNKELNIINRIYNEFEKNRINKPNIPMKSR